MSGAVAREFELDPGEGGAPLRFQVSRLKVKASLAGLRLVGGIVLPALGEAAGAPKERLGAAIARAVESLECLPQILDLFAAVTKVPSPTNPEAWVTLTPFIDNVFSGRSDLVLDYLVECTEGEYQHFFVGNGPVAVMLNQLKARAAQAGLNSPSL